MSLTRIGSIGINTGIAFAGVTTIVTLNTANDALSIGATVNVGSGITLGASGDGFFTGVVTATSFVGSGSGLTGVASTDNIRTNTNATFLQNINVSGSTTTGSLVSSGAISGTTGTFTGDLTIPDKIVHTGDTDTAIRFPTADAVSVETGGSERIRVDSSGRLGVGQNSPTALLHLKSNAPYITFEDDDNNQDWQIQATAWFAIRDQTNSAERLRIDSSGRLLLGTTTEGVSTADDLTVANSGHGGITIRTGTSSLGNLYFSDGTSGDDEYRGVVQYDHSGDFMRFLTNASERFRISSDGAIGLSGTNYGSSGQVLTSGGSGSAVSWTTVSGTTINNNADNRIISGSGTANTLTGETNLHAVNGRLLIGTTSEQTLPYTSSGAIQTLGAYNTSSINIVNNENSGNTSALTLNKIRGASGSAGGTDVMGGINWGAYDGSAWRSGITVEGRLTSIGSNAVPSKLTFKINSGSSNTERFAITPNGVTFNGDTAAANALDDYEEGTFTPTQPTVGFNSASGHYTKIGRQVTASIFVTVPTNGSGTAFVIDNMPFTSSNFSGTYKEGGYVMYTGYSTDALKVLIHDNSTRMQVYSPSGTDIPLTNLDNHNFRIQIHYTTTS